MKILLINPPWIAKKDDMEFKVTQPDGLGYIAAVLEKANHEVKLLDATAKGWKKQKSIQEKRRQ